MCVCVCVWAAGWVVVVVVTLRVVHLMEHELTRNDRLGTVYLGGATLERRHHLLHHLVEEDVR